MVNREGNAHSHERTHIFEKGDYAMEKGGPGHFQPLYGVGIHRCIAKGDLGEMRALVKEAEEFLREAGDVSSALEALKIEIAKREAR
jgi:hypothetical protein